MPDAPESSLSLTGAKASSAPGPYPREAAGGPTAIPIAIVLATGAATLLYKLDRPHRGTSTSPASIPSLPFAGVVAPCLQEDFCGMEGGNRRRRQNDPPEFLGVSAAGSRHAQPRPSIGGSNYRDPAVLPARQGGPTAGAPPSSGRDDTAAGGYGYYADPSSFAAPALPAGTMQYPGSYSPDPPRPAPDEGHFPSNLMFDMPRQARQGQAYDSVQQAYQAPRQSAAIEVLSTHFAAAPQFYMPTEPSISQGLSVPSPHAPPQFTSFSYSAPSLPARSALVSSYPPAMDPSSHHHQPAGPPIPGGADVPSLGQPTSSYEDAYDQYQIALKRTFEHTRDGRLVEAGQSLLEISEWLLSHAVELGLVVDDQNLHGDRIRLWNEFNSCWLAALQQQKDMTQGMIETGHAPPPPQSLIQEDFLERMGSNLVRLCDNMERHGLVDYQMGVWEEEIISILQECLDLLESNDENPPGLEEKTRLGLSGGGGGGGSGNSNIKPLPPPPPPAPPSGST
ncbi:MAG: hypothetical protein M1838_005248 [Thelocarpon superellum]|nr:MAG: hypothetical protein M1838_005248 [Thelocarpon superellum]